jgi:GT2 family glycosyltransferase
LTSNRKGCASEIDRVTESYDVDIIILSLNRVGETIEAIASAIAQEGITKRVLVLDQGSQADQREKLVAYCKDKPVHLELGQENLGVAGGRNKVTSLGTAPCIIALDNDAEFADTLCCKRAVDYLRSHPELGAIGFQILTYSTGEIDESSWGSPAAIRHRWNEEFDTTKFVGAGHAIMRRHFEAAGGYDDRLFFYWEETDFCYRLINMGLHIRYVPQIKILHKVSPEKRVSWDGGRYYYMVRNKLYMLQKYGALLPVTLAYAAGYLVKGRVNGVLDQVPRAIGDSFKLSRRFYRETPDLRLFRLSQAAKSYVADHDTKLRGSLLRRLRKELLGRLPGQGKSAAVA